MKILYFSHDYTTHDHRFLSSLAASEHEIYYLRLENRNRSLEKRSLPDKVRKVDWVGGKSSVQLINGISLFVSLRKVIKKIKPDVIHAGPIQTVGLLAVLSGFKPVVIMSWAFDLLFDADKNSFYRWATKKTLNNTDVLLTDCETITQLGVERGFPRERIVTFPWGIDLELFSPGIEKGLRNKLGWVEDEFVILHNRAWEPIYGVDIFAKAFVLAAKQHPELRLLLLGNGSLSPKINLILQQGRALDKVYFAGQVKQVDLPNYYRSADLYVSASHSDGSSVSLMEALGCGTPVLISDIPGNREWVTPGEQGWFFKDGDVESLAERIIQVVEQREELIKIGEKARKLAEERADWSKNFKKLLEAYELAKGLYV